MGLYALQLSDGTIKYVRAESSKEVYTAFRGIGFKKNPAHIKAVFSVKLKLPKAVKLGEPEGSNTVYNSHQFIYCDE